MLLRSLARNESTTATNNKLIQDISDIDSQTINKETLSEYLEVLERLFLVENIKPFSPELRSGIRSCLKFFQKFFVASFRHVFAIFIVK